MSQKGGEMSEFRKDAGHELGGASRRRRIIGTSVSEGRFYRLRDQDGQMKRAASRGPWPSGRPKPNSHREMDLFNKPGTSK